MALPFLFLLAGEADASPVLQECLDRHTDAESIALADCPEVIPLLDAWRDALHPPLETDTVLPAQLASVDALISAVPAEVQHPLDYAAVPAILAATLRDDTPTATVSWWDRVLDWLGQRLGEEDAPQLDWLKDWLERFTPPEDAVQAIFYLSLILIVALAVMIVINEIRALGLDFKRRRAPAHTALGGQDPAQPPASLEALRGLPPARQLPALLAWGIAHLARQGLLPDDASLTNHQCRRLLARHPAEPDFARLARRAEAVLYGGLPPTPDDCQAGFSEAQALLAFTRNIAPQNIK